MMTCRAAAAVLTLAICVLSGCATRPSELTPAATAHLPARIELSQTPFHPQDAYQCGPAALATVLQTTGIEVSPQDLTAEVFLPGRKGSLAVELIAATRSRDRLPYPLALNLLALLQELADGRPVLVMQNVGLKIAPVWHFAVVIGYDLARREIILRSGTLERLVMSERGFLRTWDLADRWALVIVEPDQLPATARLETYMTAAAGLEETGRLESAERAYALAQQTWPASAWPRLGLANLFHRRGELREAESGYRAVLAMEPDNVIALNNLADLVLRRGCTDSARAYLERASTLAEGTSLAMTVAATMRQLNETPTSSSSQLCSDAAVSE
jgi:tetratricopeptide (TPR) repeat protein